MHIYVSAHKALYQRKAGRYRSTHRKLADSWSEAFVELFHEISAATRLECGRERPCHRGLRDHEIAQNAYLAARRLLLENNRQSIVDPTD